MEDSSSSSAMLELDVSKEHCTKVVSATDDSEWSESASDNSTSSTIETISRSDPASTAMLESDVSKDHCATVNSATDDSEWSVSASDNSTPSTIETISRSDPACLPDKIERVQENEKTCNHALPLDQDRNHVGESCTVIETEETANHHLHEMSMDLESKVALKLAEDDEVILKKESSRTTINSSNENGCNDHTDSSYGNYVEAPPLLRFSSSPGAFQIPFSNQESSIGNNSTREVHSNPQQAMNPPSTRVQQQLQVPDELAQDVVLVNASLVNNVTLSDEELGRLEAQFRQQFMEEAVQAQLTTEVKEEIDKEQTPNNFSLKQSLRIPSGGFFIIFVLIAVIICAVVVASILNDNRTLESPEISIKPLRGDENIPNSRMVAYVENWLPCPTLDHVSEYTHIVIAFAVSYVWAEDKNICSQTCEISHSTPVCGNSAAADLVKEWKDAGKKVLLSFGGSGMGLSVDGINDCWEYCFGREEKVVDQLTNLVISMDLDGIDLDYLYYYEDNQAQSSFTKGAQAQQFLTQVTLGLRESLPEGSILTHSPLDAQASLGPKYFKILEDVAPSLDFLMVQYYNGFSRPVLDGIDGKGHGSVAALDHYSFLVDKLFDGDSSRLVFGFCIDGCDSTRSNANEEQASKIMADLGMHYPCNGGAFFWAANSDIDGSWSKTVAGTLKRNRQFCLSGTIPSDFSAGILVASPETLPPTSAIDILDFSAGFVVASPEKSSPVSTMNIIDDSSTCSPTRCGANWTDANGKCGAPCEAWAQGIEWVDACASLGLSCFTDLDTSLPCCNPSEGNELSTPSFVMTDLEDYTYDISGCAPARCGANWTDANGKCGAPCLAWAPDIEWVDACKPSGLSCFADLDTSLSCCT